MLAVVMDWKHFYTPPLGINYFEFLGKKNIFSLPFLLKTKKKKLFAIVRNRILSFEFVRAENSKILYVFRTT